MRRMFQVFLVLFGVVVIGISIVGVGLLLKVGA